MGEVTERPKVHDWKSCVRKRTVGSNPTLSATNENADTVFQYDSRVLRNKDSRTPPDPGGSNGSEYLCVPQGCLAIIFLMRP